MHLADQIRVEPTTITFEEANNANLNDYHNKINVDDSDGYSCILNITNLTRKTICYKIKCTATDKATAKPNFNCIKGFDNINVCVRAKKFAFGRNESSQETLLIKVAEVRDAYQLSMEELKQAFPKCPSADIKVPMIFKSNKCSTERNMKSNMNNKHNELQENKQRISEDSCLGTGSDNAINGCNPKYNSRIPKAQKRIIKCRKKKDSDLSGVESVSDSGSGSENDEKGRNIETSDSESDEKEQNIQLWANSANINNRIKILENSLAKIQKEVHATDDSVLMVSEKVQAKSKLITGVQKKFLEQKQENDDHLKNVTERIEKIDQRLDTLTASSGSGNENVKTSFPNTLQIVIGASVLLGIFCAARYR